MLSLSKSTKSSLGRLGVGLGVGLVLGVGVIGFLRHRRNQAAKLLHLQQERIVTSSVAAKSSPAPDACASDCASDEARPVSRWSLVCLTFCTLAGFCIWPCAARRLNRSGHRAVIVADVRKSREHRASFFHHRIAETPSSCPSCVQAPCAQPDDCVLAGSAAALDDCAESRSNSSDSSDSDGEAPSPSGRQVGSGRWLGAQATRGSVQAAQLASSAVM